MSEDIVVVLDALGEDDFYYRPATTKATIDKAAAEITRLRAEQGEVRGYLSRLLQSLHPSIEILPDLLGVCTQIDNVLAGQMEDITRLRAEIARLRAALDYERQEAVKATWTGATFSGLGGFGVLVAEAVAEANKAMQKYPQPNYVISKIAEEAGEVVKAAIHCAEKRETAENVAAEMKQLIAMLIRLWVEGDQVHGLPPIAAAIRATTKEVK